MNNRIFGGLIFILLIIYFSIERPIIKPIDVQQRFQNNPIPIEYDCVRENLPNGVTALYFSDPNGSLTMEEKIGGEYFLLQYQLAPSLLAVYRDTPADFSKYNWFITLRFPNEQLADITSLHGLTQISNCGDWIVLQRD